MTAPSCADEGGQIPLNERTEHTVIATLSAQMIVTDDNGTETVEPIILYTVETADDLAALLNTTPPPDPQA